MYVFSYTYIRRKNNTLPIQPANNIMHSIIIITQNTLQIHYKWHPPQQLVKPSNIQQHGRFPPSIHCGHTSRPISRTIPHKRYKSNGDKAHSFKTGPLTTLYRCNTYFIINFHLLWPLILLLRQPRTYFFYKATARCYNASPFTIGGVVLLYNTFFCW